MASVTDITGTASTQNAAARAATTQALGQDQFLTLLVAQLQNQDPLNPSDPTEFTSQLAQYSQLEQLFNLNDAMDELASAQTGSQRIGALSLIGQEVVVENDTFTLGSEPVEIGYMVDGTVSSVKLLIKNEDGKLVNTLIGTDLSAGDHFITWDGKDSAGNSLIAGTYSITVDSKSAGSSNAAVTPLVRALVNGIDLSADDPSIVTPVGAFNISSLHGAYSTTGSGDDDSG